jgi:hypothetical protein
MTQAITKQAQLGGLSAVQAEQKMQQLIVLVQEARTFAEINQIKDFNLQMDAYLRTRQAMLSIGDQIEPLRARVRELRLECELRQGALTKSLEPTERKAVLKDLGITPVHAGKCEKAAELPRSTVQAILKVQAQKSEPVRVEHLAPLVKLSKPERVAAIAKLGEVATVREAIAAIKALPQYSAPKAAPVAPATVDKRLLAAVEHARKLRAASNTLVLLLERSVQNNSTKGQTGLRDTHQIAQDSMHSLTTLLTAIASGVKPC